MTNRHQKHWRPYSDGAFNESDLPVWGYYPDRNPSIRLIDFMGNEMTHWMPAKGDIPTPPCEDPQSPQAPECDTDTASNDVKRLDWLAEHGPISWGYTGGSKGGGVLRADIDEAMARKNLHGT